jgi:hypothetical protein
MLHASESNASCRTIKCAASFISTDGSRDLPAMLRSGKVLPANHPILMAVAGTTFLERGQQKWLELHRDITAWAGEADEFQF